MKNLKNIVTKALMTIAVGSTVLGMGVAAYSMIRNGRFTNSVEEYQLAQKTERGQSEEKLYLGLIGLGVALGIGAAAYEAGKLNYDIHQHFKKKNEFSWKNLGNP